MDKYAVVSWPPSKDVKYITVDELNNHFSHDKTFDLMSPYDVKLVSKLLYVVISSRTASSTSSKTSSKTISETTSTPISSYKRMVKNPLKYFLSNTREGIVLAARHGLLSLFHIAFRRLKYYHPHSYHETLRVAMDEAIAENHMDMVRVIMYTNKPRDDNTLKHDDETTKTFNTTRTSVDTLLKCG